MNKIKMLEKILLDLDNGFYDQWAEGLSNDWHNNEISNGNIISIVKDFINCRIIELEN